MSIVLHYFISFFAVLGKFTNAKTCRLCFTNGVAEVVEYASHDIALMYDHKGYHDGLRILKPSATKSWHFRDFLFPLKWCYAYIDDENQGVLWAYMVRFKCKTCA